jgi:hypothetical protein
MPRAARAPGGRLPASNQTRSPCRPYNRVTTRQPTFFNTLLVQDWDSHPAAVVAKADANWPSIEAKLVAR